MRRRRVEVVVALLHVFAVIAFAGGEAEEALFENRILAVPQGNCKAQQLLIVADAEQAVFAPTIGAAARMVVAQRLPGHPARAVVLPHRAPLSFAEIGPPNLPAS